jgi:hypothetical protein
LDLCLPGAEVLLFAGACNVVGLKKGAIIIIGAGGQELGYS